MNVMKAGYEILTPISEGGRGGAADDRADRKSMLQVGG